MTAEQISTSPAGVKPAEMAIAWPPEPTSVEETGLDFGLLLDLCLKTIYYAGRPTARLICQRIALPLSATEELLNFLRRQELAEIVGTASRSELDYQYALDRKSTRLNSSH